MSEKKSKKELPRILIEMIEKMSEHEDLKGREKKDIVLKKMIEWFEVDEDLADILSGVIDIIIDVSKHKDKIKRASKKFIKICC